MSPAIRAFQPISRYIHHSPLSALVGFLTCVCPVIPALFLVLPWPLTAVVIREVR